MPAALETPTRRGQLLLPALLLAFVAGLSPFTVDYLLFHPDERHYADAAIRMVQTGDFLTPQTAAGEFRLKKPILPYWCVVAGFEAVGISPLGSRIGFLICGTAVVALSWWGASLAFSSRRAACFAAVAAMTHPALLISAPRSVPDVCLAVGIQLSACGFLLILRDGRSPIAGLITAFGGAAIAVLSKGPPGAAFVGYAMVFLAWTAPALLKRDWRRWTAAAAIALLASGSWFALMLARHQHELAQQFASDQLGSNRFASHAWQPVVQFPLCAGLLIAMSGPWLLASIPAWRGSGFRLRLMIRPGVQLLLGWCALYCGLAATINHVTPRYLLPAAAPLSIVIGGLLAEVDAEQLRRWLRRGAVATMCCAVASAAIAGLLCGGLQMGMLPGAAVATFAVGSAARRTRRQAAASQAVLIAVMLNATLFGAGLGLSAWRGGGMADGTSVEHALLHELVAARRIVFAGEAAQATQLRVRLGGAVPVVAASSAERIEPTDTLMIDEDRAAAWNLAGRSVQTVSHGHRIPAGDEVVRCLSRADIDGLLRRIERRFVIAGPCREPDMTADAAHEPRVR